ncbi:MAG TPA: trehalose-6-phosphate synthase [Mycobacteriales bacterium]
MQAEVVVASNRGPVSFKVADDGSLTSSRGAGGLVSALRTVLAEGNAVWVCAALSEGDRAAASAAASAAPSGRLADAGYDTGGAAVRMLALDPHAYDRAYNGIANGTLWFTSHHLYDTARQPVFDRAWRREWAAYVEVNTAFAEALAEEAAPGASVVVQDYHLCLVPRLLRDRRPDVRIGWFGHTPWAATDVFRMLPDDVACTLVRGILGADHAGFLTHRWADAFMACTVDLLGATARHGSVRLDDHDCEVGVHPLGIDGDELRARADQPDVAARREALERWANGRQVVVRIDRTELSKNIVRGLNAFRELLRTRPEWHERVVHLAFAYPSRHDLPEYREYTAAVQRTAHEINEEFGVPGWQPIRLEVSDDYPRSLAALSMADVLVVNPVRDGMNLVAKEGPTLSRDGCALVLSREAGAVAELGEWALVVNPYDVSGTADAIDAGLRMPAEERRARCDALATAATACPPQEWLAAQLAALRA